MSKPILVTGANGFVGSHVVEELLEHGYSVRCLLRPHSIPDWIETLPVDIQRVDYFDPNALRKAVEGCEAILHFGGATKARDKEGYLNANARTTKALLSAAADACPNLSLFLFCSSQAALGPSPSLDPLDESAPTRPVSVYGWSKMTAEKFCAEYEGRFPIVILRPPAVYGPRDKDVLIFFRTIRWGISPTIGRGERYISLVHAGDIAHISRLILEKKPQGTNIYHVTDGDVHRWSQVLDAIAEAMDKRSIRIAVPVGLAVFLSRVLSGFASAAGRLATMSRDKLNDVLQSYWLISSRKAEEELDYTPKYKLQEGIAMTVRWYRDHKWL